MPLITIGFGLALVALGVGMYFGTSTGSITAPIPAFAGAPLALLGLVATLREALRKHVMHAAATIGLLGFLGPAGRLISTGFAGKPAAVASQAIMASLCLVFVALCVNSFVQVRRARRRELADPGR